MLPLQGVKVVEIGQNLAGPFAAEILAMLGAEVVKIERPEGDDARGWGPPFHAGIACTFHTMNRNKRSVVLDLKDAEAIAWLHGFIGDRDILVHNMRPGAMESLGLDAASLGAINPRLIYCSLHAFGARGPMRMQPGYEPILQAFSGMFSVNGTADGPPARVGPQVLDLGTGLWAALGCLAALQQRHLTGQGCVVDTSLLETALGWLTVVFAGFNETGQQPPRHRTGNPKLIVFQAFDTADGEVVVAAANDRLFAKLTAVLGHPEWGADPRFRTNADRIAHRDILLPMLEEVMRSRGSEEWSEMLEAAGIPCSPIHDLAAVAAHPQTRALGIMQPMPGYALEGVGLPVSFDGTRPPVTSGAPALGEANAALGAPAPRKPVG
ncbi:CaiB/BaiF CoA-transferase family protein [Siccirubricoccus sp. G192]|uniref:CaiB/BaiF CoA transferase family protein n=1 Tax=Siccirubricoccus sp. G192 TaxID=2849651 RepID=UPI001C2CBF71|nr:CoA transferase [Siccirubricoccus sp. G192]MBV1796133.1 CoA transferase [Siccirubricoccus sp. G192]